MWKKVNPIFLGIVLCFTLLTILFTFQSCKRDQPETDLPESFGISAEDTFPSWSFDGQKIAFVSNRDGKAEIYIMNADGSEQTRLTKNTDRDLKPSWSPDGSRIIFSSSRDGNWEVYVMNADGSEQMRLSDNPTYDGTPSWSPDGRKIVFVSERDGNQELYIMNADGSDQTRLTDNPARERFPSWSPDSSRILFQSNRDGNYEIFYMNADGSDQTRITNKPSNYTPTWSPDGSRIIFTSNRDGNWEIYSINVDGSNPTRLTYNTAEDGAPSYSPDGRKILFGSDRDFDREVYVMDADGSNMVNLTNNAPINDTFGLTPLPRSELDLVKIPYKIVFESFRETDGKENWEICLIDADGSGFVNLTNTPETDEMYPHVSQDGRLICFVAVEGKELESKSRNVYTMNIDGSDKVMIAENAYYPCWSGDGRKIAYLPGEYPRYSSNKRATKGLEIYDFESGEAKRHPNDEIIHLAGFCWSPDGKWFVAPIRGLVTNAFKVDDKTMMRLSISGCTPDISPDGKHLVWNSSDFHLNIGTLDFDSPQNNVINHRVVIACEHDHWIYDADWSPDKNYLALNYGIWDESASVDRAAICICDLRTGKWTQITTDGIHNGEPDWVPMKVR